MSSKAGGHHSRCSSLKSTKTHFIVCGVAAALSYDVSAVSMPHSVLPLPRQRPARASSSGEVRLVQGMHPTDRKPDAASGCGGSFGSAEIALIASRETV